MRIPAAILLLLAGALAPLHAADPVADPSAKLREQLRAVTLQLRTAQTESANAKAAADIADRKSADLAAKITILEKQAESLGKQANADKAAAAGNIAKLEEQLVAKEKNLQLHKEALAKWQEGYKKAAAAAAATGEQRDALAGELAASRNLVADRERKNLALFNTATEVLDRFESYSLGKALAAREPFIGTTRVKVENLVEGYKDRILDNRIQAKKAKP